MDALHPIKTDRAAHRMEMAQSAGTKWLEKQGQSHGFQVETCVIADYSVVALPGQQAPRKRQPQFGILEITGELTLTDPAAFLAKLSQGFGRARAFGCGLMLLRRG